MLSPGNLRSYLDFEKPVAELEAKVEALRAMGEADSAVAIGDDQADVALRMAPMAALYIGGMGARGKNFYNDLMRRYGYEAEAVRIQDLYLDGKKDEAAAAVPEDFLRAINLCGPESFVKERLAAFAEAGVTVLNIVPVAGDPLRTIETLKEWTA